MEIRKAIPKDCESKIGQFLDEKDYKEVINFDCDFYADDSTPLFGFEPSEKNIIFKLRKNVFTADEQINAYEALYEAAQPSENRGIAGGPRKTDVGIGNRNWVTDYQESVMEWFLKPDGDLDSLRKSFDNKDTEVAKRANVWSIERIKNDGLDYNTWFDDWVENTRSLSREDQLSETKRIGQYICKTTYGNVVNSGIAGYFDRYPRIPYGRATAYTEKNAEKFAKCYPYMRKLDKLFAELLPQRYGVQRRCADYLDPRFKISDTVFTTITVNKNFRTAAHRDAGDLHQGFSNLSVISKDGKKHWEGGLLVLPEYEVAIELFPGDLLLINNHHGIHGNTEIEEISGTPLQRISVVCYFREKMLKLGSYEYESARRRFVEDRKNNPSHPEQRYRWNGVSAGMWQSQEWADYLKDVGLYDYITERASREHVIPEYGRVEVPEAKDMMMWDK